MKTEKASVIRVCLLIAHPFCRAYVRQILMTEQNCGVHLVNARPNLSQSRTVIVADYKLIPQPRLAYLRSVTKAYRTGDLLLLGDQIPDGEMYQLLLLGTKGFVRYSEVRTRLGAAIRALWKGHLYLPRWLLEKAIRESPTLLAQRLDRKLHFTPHELFIVRLLERGLSNKEMACELDISPRTVKFHLANIFSKVGVNDRRAITQIIRAETFRFIESYGGTQPTSDGSGMGTPSAPRVSKQFPENRKVAPERSASSLRLN